MQVVLDVWCTTSRSMSDLKRVRHRPICCQSPRSALSVQFSGEFCCDRSLGAYYTAVLTVEFTGVCITVYNILLYWSECNLPAAAGTTSRAIAPPIPSAPSSAIHMRWVGEGMHCQGGQVKQGGRIQTPKGVVRRMGETSEA